MEWLAGILAHCATIVKGGRTFCRRIYDACKVAAKNRSKHVRLNVLVCDDIVWWDNFSCIFNGRAVIQNELYDFPIVSDSLRKGFAAYMGLDWIAGTWDDSMCVISQSNHVVSSPSCNVYDESNTNVLELWPIVKCLQRWYDVLRNRKVESFLDLCSIQYHVSSNIYSHRREL